VAGESGSGSINLIEIAIVVGVFGRTVLALHGDFTARIAQAVEFFALYQELVAERGEDDAG
jgi:hypothetical protein